MASTETVLERHLAALAEGDIAKIMEDYTDESVVVTNAETFRGRTEIKNLFEGTISEFPQERMEIDIEQKTVENEFAYVVWQAESTKNIYEFGADTLYIPKDKIHFQTGAVKVVPKE